MGGQRDWRESIPVWRRLPPSGRCAVNTAAMSAVVALRALAMRLADEGHVEWSTASGVADLLAGVASPSRVCSLCGADLPPPVAVAGRVPAANLLTAASAKSPQKRCRVRLAP